MSADVEEGNGAVCDRRESRNGPPVHAPYAPRPEVDEEEQGEHPEGGADDDARFGVYAAAADCADGGRNACLA